MWRRTVLVLNLFAIIDRTSTQLDSNGTETQTPKCCPCPPGVPEPSLGLGLGSGPEARAAAEPGVTNCACGPRDADSEGAPSVFFPNAVRVAGNVVRPEPADDAKPLLQPEVDLASSVLETLRAATDEEYRDALERDAARAAASELTISDGTDVIPQEARNVVTIIVSPQDIDRADDTITEESHVQATRCIDSLLGSPRASFNYRAPVHQKGLEEILNLPLPGGLLHRQRDSNLAASNVHESVVEADNNLNRVLSGLRLRADPGLFNLNPLKIGEDINKILDGQKSALDADDSVLASHVSVQPTTLFTDSIKDPISNDNSENDVGINSDEIDNIDRLFVTDEDAVDIKQANSDSDPSPSNIRGSFAEATENDDRSGQNDDNFSKSKYPVLTKNVKAHSQNLFPLKNLLKLRDVELIPLDINKQIPKAHLNIPNVKIEPLQTNKARVNAFDLVKLPKLSDLFSKPSKIVIGNKESTEEVVDNKDLEKSANIQTIPRKTVVNTEILDAVPSPSEMTQVMSNKDNCLNLQPKVNKLAKDVDIETRDIEDSFNNRNIDTEAEQTNDAEAETKDNENVFDNATIESVESKSSESTGNTEPSSTETFETVDEDQELEQGNNNEILILSQEDVDDISPASIDLSELDKVEQRSSHPFKDLGAIRQNVIEKINALQISNQNVLNKIKQRVEEIPEGSDSIEQETESLGKVPNSVAQNFESPPTVESTPPSNVITDEFKDVGKSTEEVTFEDLQNMSDSILLASEKQAEGVQFEDIMPENHDNKDSQSIEPTEEQFDSEEISESEVDSVLGIDDADQTQNKVPTPASDMTSSGDSNNVEGSKDEEKNNLCPSDIIKTVTSKETGTRLPDENGQIDNDLEPLASEPVVTSILRPNSKSLIEHLSDFESKLRQNIIVQPASLLNTNDLNIFRTPTLNIPNISDLNTNIPTLEEIRMRVSEILGGLARTSGDEEVSSELDSDDFASNDNPILSTGESSSAPISILPPLKPLEDIHLDIIQLKPLPLIPGLHPLKSEFPGLNLNTYKAKLSVPKSLDLKPLKLASTLGNDGGLVGATLSVGPEQKVKVGKSKPKTKTNSNYVSSVQNSPTLAEITSSIQKNAQNLLNIPATAQGQTLQASNVVENIAENLKSNAENTIGNIHQTLYPSRLEAMHADLRTNANNLFNSGRNALGSLHTSAPINNVVDSLRAQTENTLKNVHQRLNSPIKITDLSTAVHKNAQNALKLPIHTTNKILKNKLQTSGTIDTALDNLKAQSENTYRNMQQTLSYPLDDLSKSIHKTAKNILKPSASVTSGVDLLRGAKQSIPQISGVVDNLRSQTESAMKNIQQTLNAPVLSDISTSIQKSAQQTLKSPLTNSNVDLLRSSLQPIPLDTVVDNLKSHTHSTMRNIQQSLGTPRLADISTTVQNHAYHLLNSPASTIGRDAFGQVLQASLPMIDLKPHAEKTVKSLQKTLKATLRNSPIKNVQPLTNPDHVLQMISNHHEDVNDKLFAIQTDLADRLESIHNEVMDPERLRSILSPPSNRHFELFTIPLSNSRMSALNSNKLTRPVLKAKQPTQPSLGSQRKESRKSGITKAVKPKPEPTKLGVMRASTGNKEHGLRKPVKIPSAASSPIPAHIRMPILPKPKKPIFPKPFESDFFKKPVILEPFGPEPRQSFQSTTTRRPFIPKLKPLTDTKIKVTFASTTPRPIPSPPVSKRPLFVSTTAKPKIPKTSRFKPKPLVRQPTPWSGARNALQPLRHDPLTSPSRVVSITQTPTKSNSAMPITGSSKTGTLPRLGALSPRLTPKPLGKPTPSEITSGPQGRSSNQDSKLLSSPEKPKMSLLSKLTEALKGKQTKANLSSPSEEKNQILEMAPAASESVGKVIAIENPMKENVSYKCKMTCIKLD